MTPEFTATLAAEANAELAHNPHPFGGELRFAAEYVYWFAVRSLRLPMPDCREQAQEDIAAIAGHKKAPGTVPRAELVPG